jgi:hypothetical protein
MGSPPPGGQEAPDFSNPETGAIRLDRRAHARAAAADPGRASDPRNRPAAVELVAAFIEPVEDRPLRWCARRRLGAAETDAAAFVRDSAAGMGLGGGSLREGLIKG